MPLPDYTSQFQAIYLRSERLPVQQILHLSPA